MQLFLCTLVFSVVLSIACAENFHRVNGSSCEPNVTISLGQIQGSILTTRHGKVIYAFRGIRYAEAPIGNLRFKPPVPVKNWTVIYDATQDPPACPQPGKDNISEDCLFLNVYTTELGCTGSKVLKPVIVFFHPGGFYEGSCSSSVYGPQYLMDEDVVLVVPNYRLGSLGFMSTGTKEAPGNNGLKDQVTVLKWIKNNIASFHGDPKLVTIVGYSAGGFSVTVHLVSPLSTGLFHRAIPMSGSVFGNLPIYNNQLYLAQKQAQFLNCPDSDPVEIITCLNTKSAKELGDSLSRFDEFLNDPVWQWTAVVEPDFGQERFLTAHPIKSIQKGNFAKVPIMLGVTTDEFGSRSFDIMDNSTVLETYDKDYLRIWPIIYNYERNSPLSEKISKGLRKLYFVNGVNNSSRQGVADLYADGVIGFSINRGVKLLTEYNSKNVYYYLFDYHGRYTHAYYPGTNNTVPYGVSHHDDLLYLFYVSVMTPMFNEAPEAKIVDKMVKMWTNFAKTGNPIPETEKGNKESLGSIIWPAFDLDNQHYMNINMELMLKQKLFEERYLTWDKLIPLTV